MAKRRSYDMQQTFHSIKKLIGDVKFNDWNFLVKRGGTTPYLQIKFMAPCNMTGEMQEQACRKWQLDYHMCDEEIINTAWKAVEAAIVHEAREQFKWRGEPIYRPHYDIYALHELSKRNAVVSRKDAA